MSSSSEDEDTDDEEVKRSFDERAKEISGQLYPNKSQNKYIQCWDEFQEWLKKNNSNSLDESRFLVYFKELSQRYNSATLWSKWSMLRSALNIKHGIDLHRYTRLKAFVKKKSKDYRPNQAATFPYHAIKRFVNEAPDSTYLALKVMAILGIFCAMRCQEISSLEPNNVTDLNPQKSPSVPSFYAVEFYDSKDPSKLRQYVIGQPYYDVITKYVNLRPPDVPELNFFIKYQNGKAMRQNIRKNTIGGGPRTIAKLMNLSNAQQFKGHTWRRSAATFVANAGGTLLNVKRMGSWKSDKVGQRYVDDNDTQRLKLFNMIQKNAGLAGADGHKNPEFEFTRAGSSRDDLGPPNKIPKNHQRVSQTLAKRTMTLKVNTQDNSTAVKIPDTSKEQSADLWGEENDEWWTNVADNSVFLGAPEDNQEFDEENVATRMNASGNHIFSTQDGAPTENDSTAHIPLLTDRRETRKLPRTDSVQKNTINRQNERNTYRDDQISSHVLRDKIKSFEVAATKNSSITFTNCTIENITINHYIDGKENVNPRE